MRKFGVGDFIPDEVEAVTTISGHVFVRGENGKFVESERRVEDDGYLPANTKRGGWFEFEFPLTEVAV